MTKKKTSPIGAQANKFFLGLILSGLLVFIGVMVYSSAGKALPVLGEAGHTVGNFSFINQDGKTITGKDVEGRIRVAEYFFTTCKGICPVMNNNLKAVQDAFKNNNDVIILSHTVDPETDRPSVLKAYADRMHATPGKWEFLTGNKDALYKMAQQDYLLSADTATAAGDDGAFIHTQYITLVDKQNRIRGFYDATDKQSVQKLIADIKTL
ncbi:SCO family protein [Parafilimonas sp.]|uniref:SCO family protein n=1 Tax=Parafilimonas sp. TaxID=1969739 RepID=UPI0039E5C1FE